jgi:flavin reductase (DIM6/NTAB) family NADH-FMN oxidoreductase RutF
MIDGAHRAENRRTWLFHEQSGECVYNVLNRANAFKNFRLQPLAGKLFELDREIDGIDAIDVKIRVQYLD